MNAIQPVLTINRPVNRFGAGVLALILCLAARPGGAATITVTNAADSGAGTLRQAIATAAPGDTIDFAITGMIVLTNGELAINANLSIVGPGQTLLTISGNNASRVFNISAVTVNLSGLTIANGRKYDLPGGGIYNAAPP